MRLLSLDWRKNTSIGHRSTYLSRISRVPKETVLIKARRALGAWNASSALTLSKYLKSQNRQMDSETVYSYLNKLETACLLHRCSRYDIKGKEMLKTQEKFYLADTAFRFSILGYDNNAVASMLENIVYLELRRRGYDVFVGKLKKNPLVNQYRLCYTAFKRIGSFKPL